MANKTMAALAKRRKKRLPSQVRKEGNSLQTFRGEKAGDAKLHIKCGFLLSTASLTSS